MNFGVHCDVRRGYISALAHAEALGCGAMQLLPYRRHHEPVEAEFSAFRAAFADSPVSRLVVHVRFLPFLASTDPVRHARSVESLKREIRFAAALGGEFLIAHMGAYSPGSSREEGTEIFARGLAAAWQDSAPASLRLVLENVPGGGRRMGGALEELAVLAERLEIDGIRADFCLDTAHAWAFGEDLDGREGMTRFLDRARELWGAERTAVFHLNDSLAARGSHRENHWHWGRGLLGSAGIAALLAREDFSHAVGILETPPGRDGENLDWIRALAAARPGPRGS